MDHPASLPADTMLSFLRHGTASGRPEELAGLEESHVLVFRPLCAADLLLTVRHRPG